MNLLNEAEAILKATGLRFTPAHLNAAHNALKDLTKARDALMAGPYFRLKHGTILYCEYAGVVLEFRADRDDGGSHLGVWRLPDNRRRALLSDVEHYSFDAEGNDTSHGVSVRACPPPGPRRAALEGDLAALEAVREYEEKRREAVRQREAPPFDPAQAEAGTAGG